MNDNHADYGFEGITHRQIKTLILRFREVLTAYRNRVSQSGEAPVGESETVAELRELARAAILQAVTLRGCLLDMQSLEMRQGLDDLHQAAELMGGDPMPKWQIHDRANGVLQWQGTAPTADAAWRAYRADLGYDCDIPMVCERRAYEVTDAGK